MTGNDTAALVVALSAQLTQFEKDMANASGLADKSARNIEAQFSKINPGMQFVDELQSRLLKLGTAAGIVELIGKFAELNEETAKIGELSEAVGTSTDRFQQFRFSVLQAGGTVEQADNFLVRFSRSVAEAATGTGNLANFLRVNNINAQQFAKLPLDQQLSKYGQLLAGASTQQEKLNDLFIVGGRQAGPQLLAALQSLGPGWDQTATAAANAGTVIDRDFIERAKKSAEAWSTLKLQFAVNSQELAVSTWELLSRSVGSVASFLGDVLNKIKELQKQQNVNPSAGIPVGTTVGVGFVPGLDPEIFAPPAPTVDESRTNLQSQLTQLEGTRARVADELSSLTDDRDIANVNAELDGIDAHIAAITSKIAALAVMTRRSTPDVLSPLPAGEKDQRSAAESETNGDGSTKQYNAQADAIQKLIKAQEDRIKLLQTEDQTIGKSVYDTTYLTEKIKLEAEARKLNNGAALSPSQTAQIDKEARSIAGATAALDAHKKAWTGLNSAAQFAGGQLIDIMDGLRNKTLTVGDAVNQLANAFIHAAEQALLLGEGPLANVLGMQSSTPGATGGLIGMLISGLPGFASGTDFAPGGPAVVGENGPEVVNLPRGAQVIPNGVTRSGADGAVIFTMPVQIDARGADQAAVIRALAGLDQLNKSFEQRVGAAVRTNRVRGTRF